MDRPHLLLSYKMEEALRGGRPKTALAQYEPDAQPVHLAHRESRHASQKACAFLDLTTT